MENNFSFGDETDDKEFSNKRHRTTKSIIYSMYLKLTKFEHHFDIISTKYKYMALTWIFGTYAAIGFILSKEVENPPFNPITAVIIVCCIGMAILSLIWHLDINIYTKFWAVIFIEEIKMERMFDFLSKSRNLELLIDDDRQRIVSQGVLYMIANSLFLATIAISTVYLTQPKTIFTYTGIVAFFALSIYLMCYLMFKVAQKSQNIFFQAIKSIKTNNKIHLQ